MDKLTLRRVMAIGKLPLVAGLLAAAIVVGGSALGRRAGTPPCLEYWPEIRYRNYAYDHIVHLNNTCSARAICLVSSEMNKVGIEATVDPGKRAEVLLWRGPRPRSFTPRAQCHFVL